MDLEVARKSLSKRSGFSTKKIAFVAAVGLVIAAGIGFRAYHYLGEAPAEGTPATVETAAPEPAATSAPEAAQPPSPATTTESVAKTSPATQEAVPAASEPAPTQPAAPAPGEPSQQIQEAGSPSQPEEAAASQAEQADLPGSGMILVARKPVQVLASPSATAPAMYGFPAGRPFRVIGREGDFVQIKDLRSSASGWIDAAALAAPPPSAAPLPRASAPSAPPSASPAPTKQGSARKPATAAADPKPKPAKKGAPPVADAEPPATPNVEQARRPPSLFGRGGFFGGVFGGGNAN